MKALKINLDQLITFYFIVIEGSLSGASARLCISQPAVTMQIAALQKQFGVKLIRVKKKKVNLTKAGEMLFIHAEEAYRSAMRAESLLHGHRSNNLRIGVAAALMVYLIPVVDQFTELYPSVKVTVREGRSLNIIEELLDFEHDLCIVGAFENVNKELRAFHIPDVERMILVGAPGDPLAQRQMVQWKDLDGYPFILHCEGSIARTVITREFRKRNIKPSISAEIDNIKCMKRLIESGKGVGLMFYPNVKEEIAHHELSIIPLVDGDLKVGIDVIVNRETALSPPAADFLALTGSRFGCIIAAGDQGFPA
ncbi:LysR family transcriptional regulator [Syntrophorhabdus aromaticivorans]|uniref:LysR family transcriptional regulator n=1 Tax=Syntrophorhabdus aromaticivorans TaxID=328301 RepID=A0A971M743_9BACT|nr:LysR family transcriptional regulator [Syntrophorhabdus aromaticivorans]NLW36411.1 LysR family transcriptional regulator [Syntrophorhabdus aromaticivorans]